MNIRPLLAALALVSLGAPLAAHADAPSGDIDTVFAIDQAVKAPKPQFDRKANVASVGEGAYPVIAATPQNQRIVTRDEVRKQLATMPQERVGA